MGVGAAAVVVDVVAGTGFPDASATGIERAMQDTTGFVFAHNGGVTTVTQVGGAAACAVTYTEATGVVNAAAIRAANCPS
jgi:MSHA pilin protein MshA